MVEKTSVKMVKLLTGETVLAEALDTGSSVRVKNPLVVVVMPSRNPNETKPSVAFAPWVEFTKEKEFNIRGEHVVAVYTPIDEFRDEYARIFSGLMTPNKQLILPGN